jgi:predicted transcriptional regulator
MTLTIDLPPELEERLQREAEKRGLTVSEYTRHLIEQLLPARQEERKSLWETLTPDEWERAFDEYLASHVPTKPPLPPEAFERASFYGERG